MAACIISIHFLFQALWIVCPSEFPITSQIPRAKALRPVEGQIRVGRGRENRRKELLPAILSGKQSKLRKEVSKKRGCSTSKMRPAEAPDLEGKVSPEAAPHHPQHRASLDLLCKKSHLLQESNKKKKSLILKQQQSPG